MRATLPDGGNVEMTLILAGLALPCLASAGDGLVPPRTLLQVLPIGGRSVTLKGVVSFLVGMLALAIALGCLFLAFGFFLLGSTLCHGSFACLISSVEFPAWGWFAVCAGWFFLVWLRFGDSHQRVLVYGRWYHEDQVARLVAQQLSARGLAPIPEETLYDLESDLVRRMHERGWIVHGWAWLDGGQKRSVVEVPPDEMLRTVLREPAYRHATDAEREAIRFLLEYFLAQARRAEQVSPIWRWWVGTAQIAKGQVYGRRAT
jgi:hypothetical protein